MSLFATCPTPKVAPLQNCKSILGLNKQMELSILIPTYNDECYQLVSSLQQQAAATAMSYEIVVADDGSDNEQVIAANRAINSLPHCRLIECHENRGRAVIRNVLVQQAQYSYLLFIDSDMKVCRPDFILRYMEASGDVVCGGLVIGNVTNSNLRSIYEQSKEHEHTLQMRRQRPYQDFHTANFMVRHALMLRFPFDERFRYYGYEDVLLGKRLQQAGIVIKHIDNPLSFEIYETNEAFLNKTEEGLRTLHQFQDELQGYSRLLEFTERHPLLARMIGCWHRIAGKWERRQLSGSTPNLLLFSLYRLGYFLQL